jgi:hypothetical protein
MMLDQAHRYAGSCGDGLHRRSLETSVPELGHCCIPDSSAGREVFHETFT